MKVNITKESRKWMTVEELDYAKKIVKDMKDDGFTPMEYAKMAADSVLWHKRFGEHSDSVRRVLEASAEICRDYKIPVEQFGEGCGYLGVWIDATVETWSGFMKIGCLLSDIWALGTDEAARDLIDHSWIRYYAEQK